MFHYRQKKIKIKMTEPSEVMLMIGAVETTKEVEAEVVETRAIGVTEMMIEMMTEMMIEVTTEMMIEMMIKEIDIPLEAKTEVITIKDNSKIPKDMSSTIKG